MLRQDFRRRDLLRVGALAGIGLAAKARAADQRMNCILLSLTGGPSHLDTWDMKPDAPSEIRGPYRPIKTNVPGMEICEIFPRMAKMADKYAILRGVYHTGEPTHEAGEAMTRIGCGAVVDERYGSSCFGRRCFEARRMIEAGARFVKVDMFDSVYNQVSWDIHGFEPFSPIECYRDVVGPMFDTAYTALLTDLEDRGLLSTTIVVAMGEFGRTPKINAAGGRDHWPECMSVLLAGGPIQGGQVIGSSDRIGAEPKDSPMTPDDIRRLWV
jgi:hypothetical protein